MGMERSHRCSRCFRPGVLKGLVLGRFVAPKDVHVNGHRMLRTCHMLPYMEKEIFLDGIKDLKMVREVIPDHPGRLNVISMILRIGKQEYESEMWQQKERSRR